MSKDHLLLASGPPAEDDMRHALEDVLEIKHSTRKEFSDLPKVKCEIPDCSETLWLLPATGQLMLERQADADIMIICIFHLAIFMWQMFHFDILAEMKKAMKEQKEETLNVRKVI